MNIDPLPVMRRGVFFLQDAPGQPSGGLHIHARTCQTKVTARLKPLSPQHVAIGDADHADMPLDHGKGRI